MIDLTAIILTKNEETNIAICIKSIEKLAKRILVIDSFSTDGTVEIAKKLGAEVHQHKFENYSRQFHYGLHQFDIQTKWVLRIDADESLTPKAIAEIEDICNENMETDINGIILRFEVIFMGKKLNHGGIYPFRKLLVFKYGIGEIENRNMDEHIVLTKGRTIMAKEDCCHREYKGLTFWINKHNWYASREAADYFEDIHKKEVNEKLDLRARAKRAIKFNIYYKLPIGMRAYLYYIYRYYFKLGFLDGKEGKIFCFLHAYWYRYLVDAKIYEAKKNKELPVYSKGLNQ